MPLWPFRKSKAKSDVDDKSMALVLYSERQKPYKSRQAPSKNKGRVQKATNVSTPGSPASSAKSLFAKHSEKKVNTPKPGSSNRVGGLKEPERLSRPLSVTDMVKLQDKKLAERLNSMKARPPTVVQMAKLVRSRSDERGRGSSRNREGRRGKKARSVSLRAAKGTSEIHQPSPKDLKEQMYKTKLSRYLDGRVEGALPGDELKSDPFEWSAKQIMSRDDYAENMTREMLCQQAQPIARDLQKRDMNTVRRGPQRRGSAWNMLSKYSPHKNGESKLRPSSMPPLFGRKRRQQGNKGATTTLKEGDVAGAVEHMVAKSGEVMEGVSDVFNVVLNKKRDNTAPLKKQLSDRLTVQQYIEKQKNDAVIESPKLEKSFSAKVVNPLGAMKGLVGEPKGSPKRGGVDVGDKGKQLAIVKPRAPPQLRGSSSRNMRPQSAPIRGRAPAPAQEKPALMKQDSLKSIREKRPDQYKQLSVHHGWHQSAKGDTVRSIFGQRPKISKLGFGNDSEGMADSD